MQWYYAKQGKTFGPVDEAELQGLAQAGMIGQDDFVWNQTMGDTWARASSIDGLFSGCPPNPYGPPSPSDGPACDYGAVTGNADLTRLARESLRSNWGIAVCASLLFGIILWGVSVVPVLGAVASAVARGPMKVGLCTFYLALAGRRKVELGQILSGANRFGTAFLAAILTAVFTFLWSLLLIIPGIVACYSYAMTFYVIADDPSVTATEAIARSKAMMRGKRIQLFLLTLRFLGWAILCLFTLGIGFLWLTPYIETSVAHFYEYAKRNT